jgi:hypothetical protein
MSMTEIVVVNLAAAVAAVAILGRVMLTGYRAAN